MSRRIELELTSARPDGNWTWRAAGAREPRGVLDGGLLPAGSKVGDVLRADADFDVDGITVVSVLAPKGARKEPERIELLTAAPSFEPVTQTLVAKRDRPRREGDRDDRRPRRDGERGADGDRGRPRNRGDRTDRPARGPRPDAGGERPGASPGSGRPRAERPPRPPVPELPVRPKPKRLRPVRSHRNAVLADLPPEQKAVAEQVLRGGVPAVRQALEEQNAQLRAEGKPEVPPAGVVALAEELLPRLRVAEWRDRAEGALNDLDELDLRDLRSVVVASDDPAVARDESTREMAARLKDGLSNRQDKEHQDWLADIDAALGVGRVVRALRLSSRPPKAGVRFPPELAGRLSQASLAALTADASSDRWVAVLEALAYSPVHAHRGAGRRSPIRCPTSCGPRSSGSPGWCPRWPSSSASSHPPPAPGRRARPAGRRPASPIDPSRSRRLPPRRPRPPRSSRWKRQPSKRRPTRRRPTSWTWPKPPRCPRRPRHPPSRPPRQHPRSRSRRSSRRPSRPPRHARRGRQPVDADRVEPPTEPAAEAAPEVAVEAIEPPTEPAAEAAPEVAVEEIEPPTEPAAEAAPEVAVEAIEPAADATPDVTDRSRRDATPTPDAADADSDPPAEAPPPSE